MKFFLGKHQPGNPDSPDVLGTGLTEDQENYVTGIVEKGIREAVAKLPSYLKHVIKENRHLRAKDSDYSLWAIELLELGSSVGHTALLGNLFEAADLEDKINCFAGNFSTIKRKKSNVLSDLDEVLLKQKMLETYAPEWEEMLQTIPDGKHRAPHATEIAYSLRRQRGYVPRYCPTTEEKNTVVNDFITNLLQAMLEELPRIQPIHELLIANGSALSLGEHQLKQILGHSENYLAP